MGGGRGGFLAQVSHPPTRSPASQPLPTFGLGTSSECQKKKRTCARRTTFWTSPPPAPSPATPSFFHTLTKPGKRHAPTTSCSPASVRWHLLTSSIWARNEEFVKSVCASLSREGEKWDGEETDLGRIESAAHVGHKSPVKALLVARARRPTRMHDPSKLPGLNEDFVQAGRDLSVSAAVAVRGGVVGGEKDLKEGGHLSGVVFQ